MSDVDRTAHVSFLVQSAQSDVSQLCEWEGFGEEFELLQCLCRIGGLLTADDSYTVAWMANSSASFTALSSVSLGLTRCRRPPACPKANARARFFDPRRGTQPLQTAMVARTTAISTKRTCGLMHSSLTAGNLSRWPAVKGAFPGRKIMPQGVASRRDLHRHRLSACDGHPAVGGTPQKRGRFVSRVEVGIWGGEEMAVLRLVKDRVVKCAARRRDA